MASASFCSPASSPEDGWVLRDLSTPAGDLSSPQSSESPTNVRCCSKHREAVFCEPCEPCECRASLIDCMASLLHPFCPCRYRLWDILCYLIMVFQACVVAAQKDVFTYTCDYFAWLFLWDAVFYFVPAVCICYCYLEAEGLRKD